MRMAPVMFAVGMIALGVIALLFPSAIRRVVLGVINARRATTPFLSSMHTIWSIRFGGLIALVIGIFILWVLWRNR